jgi:hypothetical protein
MKSATTLRHPIPIHRQLHGPRVLQIRLERREVAMLSGDQTGAQIVSVDSVLWITQEGDPDDHFLQPGERYHITGPGRVVIQGMRRS